MQLNALISLVTSCLWQGKELKRVWQWLRCQGKLLLFRVISTRMNTSVHPSIYRSLPPSIFHSLPSSLLPFIHLSIQTRTQSMFLLLPLQLHAIVLRFSFITWFIAPSSVRPSVQSSIHPSIQTSSHSFRNGIKERARG